MKSCKKVLSIILAIVIVISIVPITASATTSGTCGDNLTWTYDTSTYTLTISGAGSMKNYSWDNRPWKSYEDSIKTVVINNGVTTIGTDAFWGCSSLTSVTIGDSVTTIGDGAFSNCDSLTSITIPDGVTGIGSSVFEYCTSLTNITVDSDNQHYSSNEDGVLFNKDKTTLIQYPIGNVRTNYTIPDSVTAIGDDAFSYCDSLTNVTIPDSVTTIGGFAFQDCISITSVTIGDGVEIIGDYAFYGCEYLTSVTLPYSVTSIGNYAFLLCYSLTNIIIPDSVTTIGSGAFCDCGSLTSITIPDSVITIGDGAFSGCTSLTSITIPNSVTTIGYATFHGCDSLTSVTISDSVTTIGDYAFYNCTSLSNIYYSATFVEWMQIEIGNYNDSLNRATLYFGDGLYTGFKGKCGENVFWAFDNSTYTLTIFGTGAMYDVYNETGLPWMCFLDMYYEIKTVVINYGVTTISDYAFLGCRSLTSVTIPDTVTRIGVEVFSNCDNLTSIVIPDSVISIGNFSFYACTSLTDVYYSGTEEEWNKIAIESGNESLLNATLHFNYCEHDYVDGTCTDCAKNKPIAKEMSSQIRFDRNVDGSYAKTFAVRTRAMISDKDFTELVGATNTEAIKNIDKIGFVYTLDSENFSTTSAQAVAQGEKVEGYTDAPVSYVQDADGYYMFTCLVTNIPETDKDHTLTAYAYLCVNGKWYFSEAPMNADFNSLYEEKYPLACEKYGWEA